MGNVKKGLSSCGGAGCLWPAWILAAERECRCTILPTSIERALQSTVFRRHQPLSLVNASHHGGQRSHKQTFNVHAITGPGGEYWSQKGSLVFGSGPPLIARRNAHGVRSREIIAKVPAADVRKREGVVGQRRRSGTRLGRHKEKSSSSLCSALCLNRSLRDGHKESTASDASTSGPLMGWNVRNVVLGDTFSWPAWH